MSHLEDVNQQLEKAEKTHSIFSTRFGEKFRIRGKTIPEWTEYLRITLPPDLDTKVCQNVDVKLSALSNEISFYKGECECALQFAKSIYQKKFRTKYVGLVKSYKANPAQGKLPSKDTLTLEAEEGLEEYQDTITYTEMELSFWKEALSNLYSIRKIIEGAGYTLGIEARAMQYQNYLNNMNKDQ